MATELKHIQFDHRRQKCIDALDQMHRQSTIWLNIKLEN